MERSTRGVVLTDAGRLLLAAADAVHAELQTAARQLRDLQANGPQTLTVATFASAGEPLLAPALTELTTAAGNTIDVTVIEAEPDDALAALRSGGSRGAPARLPEPTRGPPSLVTTVRPLLVRPALRPTLEIAMSVHDCGPIPRRSQACNKAVHVRHVGRG